MRLKLLLAAVLGLVVTSAASGATSTTTVVVRQGAMGSWATQMRDPNGVPVAANDPYCHGSVGFVSGPASPPLGVGSAELRTGNGTTGGDCSAELRNSAYAGVKLSSLTALSYSTYDAANLPNGQQFPYLEIYVNWTGGAGVDDALFFEPPFQAPGSGGTACANQAATVMNMWQQWDALHGCWWSNDGTLNPGTGTGTLADYLAAHPNATIVNSSTGGGVHLLVGFASATDQFDGYVDAFRIATSSSDTTYDFEPTTPLLAGTTICNGTYSGTGTDVVVPSGDTCTLVPGTQVKGSVTVQRGGTLHADGVWIGGDLASSGSATVCGSRIRGDVAAKGGLFKLGGPSCAGNKIAGSVTVRHDAANVWVWGNTITNGLTAKKLTGKTESIVGNIDYSSLLVADSGPPVEISHNRAYTARCVNNKGQTGSGNHTTTGINTCPR